jgi:hypothetical protein
LLKLLAEGDIEVAIGTVKWCQDQLRAIYGPQNLGRGTAHGPIPPTADFQASEEERAASVPPQEHSQQSTSRLFHLAQSPVQDQLAQPAMRSIVDVYVRHGNRRALDDLRANRKGLIAGLTLLRGDYDPSKVIAQCEDELAIIEAAFAMLDEAAAA